MDEPEKKELTMEERKAEVEAQIKNRALRELEKCLIRIHQAWLILQKHAKKYDLERHLTPLDWLQRSLFLRLFTGGVVLIFQKHAGILRALGYTGEELLEQWRQEGLIE